MIEFTINGRAVKIDVEPDTPLLWVIRDEAGLTGTKYGCGIGMCGACTVHVGGRATRSCITAVQDVASHTPRTRLAARKNPARYGDRVRNEANMRTADKPAENDAVGLPSKAKCTV